MSNNFIVEYSYQDNLLSEIDSNNIYIHYLEKNFLEKINSDEKFLPCLLVGTNDNNINGFDEFDEFDELDIIKKTVVIILPNQKIIYGFYQIKSILTDVNNSNDLQDSHILYDKLINRYNLVKIPKLFFVKFDKIISFKYKIEIKEINKKFKYDCNYTQIKINSLAQSICIIKNIYLNINEYLEMYIRQQEKLIATDTNTNANTDIDINTNEITIYMNVPILWNGCEEIRNNIRTGTIKKKTILHHLSNCLNCEIVDNNIEKLDIKKKMGLNILDNSNEMNLDIFDKLVESYGMVKKFKYINKIFESFESEINLDHINIFAMKDQIENNIYSQCYFIISK